ncbi:hypothetical protein DXG01_007203 [Tephrocybe rancida]|nr:hypothetical protein DXG01_007203 [Tephrocybe rancida]
MALFLSPNIIDIAFAGHPEARVQLSLISTLHSRYPNMENINFELPYESVSNGVNIISTALRGWHKLREVTVHQISTEAYRHLAMLPKLRSLELSLCNGRSDTLGSSLVLPAFPSGSATFMALRILTVHCQNINFCISILAHLSSNRTLTSLTLQFDRSASAAQWKGLTETIEQMCPASLSTIHVADNNSFHFEGNMDDFTLKEEHLEPLFSFPNLEWINLCPVSVDINDDNYERITQTWPGLIFWGIDGFARNQPPPRPTLAVLQSFAKNCPKISLLTMRLDGTVPCTSNANSRVFTHSLRSISLEDSPIADPAMAAAYLSDILPYMDSIYYEENSGEDPERQKLWAEVVRLHKVFRAVRLQEMARSQCQRKRA